MHKEVPFSFKFNRTFHMVFQVSTSTFCLAFWWLLYFLSWNRYALFLILQVMTGINACGLNWFNCNIQTLFPLLFLLFAFLFFWRNKLLVCNIAIVFQAPPKVISNIISLDNLLDGVAMWMQGKSDSTEHNVFFQGSSLLSCKNVFS